MRVGGSNCQACVWNQHAPDRFPDRISAPGRAAAWRPGAGSMRDPRGGRSLAGLIRIPAGAGVRPSPLPRFRARSPEIRLPDHAVRSQHFSVRKHAQRRHAALRVQRRARPRRALQLGPPLPPVPRADARADAALARRPLVLDSLAPRAPALARRAGEVPVLRAAARVLGRDPADGRFASAPGTLRIGFRLRRKPRPADAGSDSARWDPPHWFPWRTGLTTPRRRWA